MRSFILILLLIYFSTLSLFAKENLNVISLTETCEDKECKPLLWWIKDDFQQEYLNLAVKPDSTWKEVNKFPIWVNKFYKIDSNVHTFTFFTFFDIPESMLSENKKSLGLGFSEIGEVFEIYINGHLVAKEGEMENGKILFHRTVRGKTFHVLKEFLKEKENQLVIKISGNPRFDHTGLYFAKDYYFGDFDEISYLNRDFTSVVLSGIYIVFGLYHLFLFLKRRKDRNNFYFGYWSIAIGIYFYTRTNLIFENYWDSEMIQRVEFIVLYPMAGIAALFFEEMFFQKVSKAGIGYLVLCVILALPTIVIPMHFSEELLLIWQLGLLLYGFPLMIYRLIQATRRDIPNAKLVLVVLLVTMCAAIFDILDSMIFNTGLSFTKYAFFAFIMMLMFILANKFVELHHYTEDLNASLEKKVEERTKELFVSLEKVNELKTQQDGDYYLTSLITRPLGLNLNKSKYISTEIYVAQKKKYHFRNKHGELGGDICVTGNLRFEEMDNRYTMFFNGDAMGKSMQGAGGAIVAGTLINNIMSKSARNDKILTAITPEKWLKAAFNELEKTFGTFGGCMLVSGVVGLLSENTGELLFFNAEHPCIVLLRDGVAEFIDKEIFIRKLGTGVNDKFVLIKFQLIPGDIVFVGSDGRDDIRIGESRIMNEDETLFLKSVTDSKGNLQELVRILESTGEISDDLSIIRIGYREKEISQS